MINGIFLMQEKNVQKYGQTWGELHCIKQGNINYISTECLHGTFSPMHITKYILNDLLSFTQHWKKYYVHIEISVS